MPRKHRLDTIVHHAGTQQDNAARALANILQQKKAAEEQLKQLRDYQQDYKEVQLKARGHSVRELQNHQVFITKLGLAIEQQEATLNAIEGNITQYTTYWQQSKTRVDALSQLVNKQNIHQQIKENRREQQEMDELSTRRRSSRST